MVEEAGDSISVASVRLDMAWDPVALGFGHQFEGSWRMIKLKERP